MRNIRFLLAAFVAACSLLGPARADTLVVAGTGSSAPLVRMLFDAFKKQVPDSELQQISPPLGSGGAIKALAAGQIDLAVSGRRPTATEESGVGQHFELGRTPFVFASSDGQRKQGLVTADLVDIYSGKLNKWDNGRSLRLILRSEFESDTQTVRAIATEVDAAVSAAFKRPGMVMGKDDLDTLALLVKTPGSFSTTTLGLLRSTQSSLVVFPLNGIAPSVASLKDGRYPLSKGLTVVFPNTPKPLAKRFGEFLHSPEAKEILRRNEFLTKD